jgi:hypothetical protein
MKGTRVLLTKGKPNQEGGIIGCKRQKSLITNKGGGKDEW